MFLRAAWLGLGASPGSPAQPLWLLDAGFSQMLLNQAGLVQAQKWLECSQKPQAYLPAFENQFALEVEVELNAVITEYQLPQISTCGNTYRGIHILPVLMLSLNFKTKGCCPT